jgi:hypothetical protein
VANERPPTPKLRRGLAEALRAKADATEYVSEDCVKNLFAAAVIIAIVSTPLYADLKYTTHLEIKKAAGSAPPANPMIAIVGDAVMKQMVPDGSADLLYIVGDKAARVEYQQAAMGLPAGTINLLSLDGTMVVLNPNEKTYWKTSTTETVAKMKAAGVAIPEVTAKRTGQFDTVAGAKCEVVTFDWKMALPIPEAARATLPPDFPSTIAMTGDSCVTFDAYKPFAEVINKGINAMMAAMGFDKIAQGGFPLRQTFSMNGLEMRMTVTEISEGAAPEHAYEIPADYKEVPMPSAAGK